MGIKSHPEAENKNVSISVNLLYKIKCMIFMAKINENNNVF